MLDVGALTGMTHVIIIEVLYIIQQALKVENEKLYEVDLGSPLLFFAKWVFAVEAVLILEATKTDFD